MSLSRRGVGLPELLLALALTGIAAALTARLVLSAAERLRDRSERIGSEHALRVAAAGIRAALESLGMDTATGPDLTAFGAATLTARATRGSGVLCAALPGLLVVRDGPAWWTAYRAPVAGRDSILAASLSDTAWRAFALVAVPRPVPCPDGTPGLGLPVAPDSAAAAALGPGAPLASFEPVELRQYSAVPGSWLGLRLPATLQPIQPVAGPFGAGGLGLAYQRRDGSPALLPAEVAAAAIRLDALTERAGGLGVVRGGAPRPDSLALFVALVNQR